MAALQLAEDELEVLLGGDVDWVDDVTRYECVRCKKILVHHYISSCDHKFCSNCKIVLDDGSQRWRCPVCREYIRNMERQDPNFRDRVMKLRLHCTNRNYGCKHACALKDLKNHVEGCEHTKERALPALYKGSQSLEMLEMKAELNWMKQKLVEIENGNRDDVTDVVRKLVNKKVEEVKAEAEEMRQKMMEMERNERVKIERNFEDQIKDLRVENQRLKIEISEIKAKQVDEKVLSMVEENRLKITKLEGKSEALNDMTDARLIKNYEAMKLIKDGFLDELKEKEVEMESKVDSKISTLKNEIEKISVFEEKTQLFDNKMETTGQSISKMLETLKKCEWDINESKSDVEILDSEFDFISIKNREMQNELKTLTMFTILLNPQIQYFHLTEDYNKLEPEFSWRLKNVESIVDNRQVWLPLKSESFWLKKYPCVTSIELQFTKDTFCLNVRVMKTNSESLTSSLPNRVYLTLKSNAGSNDKKITCENMHLAPLDGVSVHYESPKFPISCLTNPSYKAGDSVSFDLHVEPPEVAQLAISHDGTFTWAIDNYLKRQRMITRETNELHVSPYFYSSPTGSRLQVKMSGNGKQLRTDVIFLRGELCTNPSQDPKFKARVTFFHPFDPTRKTTEDILTYHDMMNSAISRSGIPLVEEKDIKNVLHDDTLYYRVEIKVLNEQ